jgi:hypothetical protein
MVGERGRGVPNAWVRSGRRISLSNVPLNHGRRLGLSIETHGRTVTLRRSGGGPGGPVLFQLPAFVHNLVRSSAGTVDPATGTIRLSTGTRLVTVVMSHGV